MSLQRVLWFSTTLVSLDEVFWLRGLIPDIEDSFCEYKPISPVSLGRVYPPLTFLYEFLIDISIRGTKLIEDIPRNEWFHSK